MGTVPMGRPKELTLTLVTMRTVGQGTTIHKKLHAEYRENVGVCSLALSDMHSLGVAEGNSVRVTTDGGSVVVRVLAGLEGMKGLVLMPLGPWASAVSTAACEGSGLPGLKGLEAKVSRAPGEEVEGVRDLLRRAVP